MNTRQRRGLLLMALGVLGAFGVFLSVLSYVNGISEQVGPSSPAYTFSRDVSRNAVVTAEDLEQIQVPNKWRAGSAISSFDATRGLVATADVRRGSVLQEGMVGPPPELKPGEREIAILIDAETGVAGKIRSGDLVDIYATFKADEQGEQARILVSNATVLAIGQLQQISAEAQDQEFGNEQVVPVTFALDVEDSLKLTYAESFATKLRLALIAPGSRSNAIPRDSVLRRGDLFPQGPAQ